MEVHILAWVREAKNLVKLIIADVEESFVKLHNYVERQREGGNVRCKIPKQISRKIFNKQS